MWLVTSQKTGASASGVQRVLGFGSYRTAWTWLHKLRRAMVRPGRDRLAGRGEGDETDWGGVPPRAGAETLEAFISSAIEPGSTIHTDGWHGYWPLKRKGYIHEVSL